MDFKTIPTTFSIEFIGGLTKLSDLISQVRARVYYKNGNRNGTWITRDFAEKLNRSLPHVPIVASYNQETEDFEDHEDKTNKKAYGFIPSNPNLQWNTGTDGQEYLTTDVYLWTGYWPEAAKIINKSQSMELEPTSIMGDFKVINGDYYFVYQDGAFKGLCVLGDTVLPCFEKAAFFSLDEESRSFFQSLNEFNEKNLEGGKTEMVKELEDNFAEVEIVPEVEVIKEDELIDVVIEEEEIVKVEEEAKVEEEFAVVEPVVEVDDRQITIDSLKSEIVGYQTQITDLSEQLTAKQTEIDELQVYKFQMLKAEKLNIIEQFKKRLLEEEISPFIDSIDNYNTDELRTKLSIVLAEKMLKEIVEVEVKPQTNYVAVPSNEKEDGIISILRKNKKN